MYLSLSQGLFPATFIERPNRFLARAKMGEQEVLAFLADPGRLKELLQPGAEIYLTPKAGPGRKTFFDLALVRYNGVLVSVDSRLPNRIFAQAIKTGGLPEFSGYKIIKPEVKCGESRLDFLLEGEGQPPCYVEVKSVTLVVEGEARFPDAPTLRGARHLEELANLRKQGCRAAVVFLIQREDVLCFAPNEETDPHFAATLRKVVGQGVEAIAYRCKVDFNGVGIIGPVEVKL